VTAEAVNMEPAIVGLLSWGNETRSDEWNIGMNVNRVSTLFPL